MLSCHHEKPHTFFGNIKLIIIYIANGTILYVFLKRETNKSVRQHRGNQN